MDEWIGDIVEFVDPNYVGGDDGHFCLTCEHAPENHALSLSLCDADCDCDGYLCVECLSPNCPAL